MEATGKFPPSVFRISTLNNCNEQNDNINLIINNDNSRCRCAGEERQYIPLRLSGRQFHQGFRARRIADTDEA